MKLITKISFAILSVAFLLPAQAAVETYTFDPHHTSVLWHVNHMGFSEVSGKWPASGTLKIDQSQPKNSQVNVTIKMADIATGVPDFDEHLKSKDFFNVAEFPTATFVSDKVTVTGKNTVEVSGQLTLHGVTKPVTLHLTLNKSGEHPYNKKQSVGFSGKAELKRSEFGVGAYVPNVSDKVKLEIEAEAQKN